MGEGKRKNKGIEDGETDDNGSEREGETKHMQSFFCKQENQKTFKFCFYKSLGLGKQICEGKSAHPELGVLGEPYSQLTPLIGVAVQARLST
jgi:hypothetical protein